MIVAYLKYRIQRIGPHGAHSPYLFQLLTKKNKEESWLINFNKSENLISNYLKRNRIARRISIRSWDRKRLFQFACSEQPNQVLETGTGLGVSSAFFAHIPSVSGIITIDHDADRIDKAAKFHKQASCSNKINYYNSTIFEQLQLLKGEVFDWIFLDANHQSDAVLQQVELIKPLMHQDSWLIIHDINWSKDMQKAWEILKNDTDFHLSMDQFSYGIVSKKPDFKEKQHFVI